MLHPLQSCMTQWQRDRISAELPGRQQQTHHSQHLECLILIMHSDLEFSSFASWCGSWSCKLKNSQMGTEHKVIENSERLWTSLFQQVQ